jgi:hypothetical protein
MASARCSAGSGWHYLRPKEPSTTALLIGSGLSLLAVGITLASLIAALRGPSNHAGTTAPNSIA